MPLPNACTDVVISNGAFCLTPDKKAGLKELYRVLRPGGRISLAMTTIKEDLPEGIEGEWPLCMRAFGHLSEIEGIAKGCGFEGVKLDLSDSLMTQEVDFDVNDVNSVDVDEEANNDTNDTEIKKSRKKIHGVTKGYNFLDDFDMNKLCARVVVSAQKPL